MFPLLFAGFALAQAALFGWLLQLWRGTRAPAAAVLLVPQAFLVWDNLRVAMGGLIGHGTLLYWLSWPAFWSHWLTGCWLIIASGSILRLADFAVARSRVFMGAFCALAAALMLHDLPLFWTRDIHPVCELGLVRYSGAVSEATRCSPDQPLVAGGFPVSPVVTCFVVIGAGLVLQLRRGFPWMAAGGIAMLLTAAVPALRAYKLDNLGEVLIVLGATLAIARFARATPRDGSPAPADPAPRGRGPG